MHKILDERDSFRLHSHKFTSQPLSDYRTLDASASITMRLLTTWFGTARGLKLKGREEYLKHKILIHEHLLEITVPEKSGMPSKTCNNSLRNMAKNWTPLFLLCSDGVRNTFFYEFGSIGARFLNVAHLWECLLVER
jgi:hypothetical protein